MKMHPKWGIPMADRNNVLEVFAELGIKPWKELKPPEDLAKYLTGTLEAKDRDDATRFAPKSQVVFLEQPNGTPFTGFRSTGRDWATVVAKLKGDLIPVVGEYKHGTGCISLCCPSGVIGKADDGSFENAGRREFEEETGLTVKTMTPLGSPNGIGVSTRQSTQKCYSFLATVDESVALKPSKLDASEVLKLVLIPVRDWLAILDEKCEEASAHLATLLALRKLGWLQM